MQRIILSSTLRVARTTIGRRAYGANPTGFNPAFPDTNTKAILGAAILFTGWAVVFSKGDNNVPFSSPTEVLNKPGTGEANEDDDDDE
ncbi:hypothetical protein BABINDRAFT_162438 [Babjeviella inositovora NRRL Y-12698]|uniref:Uncharacterized protein n=1 Tax=Babjeviella inositovora NRRL Y-12698 TaxID=984486 RepID=A0A1E3QP40_9ASCO|nr:uncharacterized protein BABINDRAFT_162438 [Babjeviella inositovora NRRL Y-12698]ODQ78747.1 hypothetical protein BABINDRAFT_162438 [Babjeviella inositovora NRRL Y-12698]